MLLRKRNIWHELVAKEEQRGKQSSLEAERLAHTYLIGQRSADSV
jgi:hypothetical protein